jgi:hypothetical protein
MSEDIVMPGKEPGEPLLVKLMRSYMARRIFWCAIRFS